MQYFKGDAEEIKFYQSGLTIAQDLSTQKDLFLAGAFETAPLGDLIYDAQIAPLANAIDREIFRESFKQIFEAFVVAGSFESYITVFEKIFGEDVEITFTVPAPGKLNIDIVAAGVELSDFVARYIFQNAYLLDEVIEDNETPDDPDNEDDIIAFQTIKGFQSQYELETMLFEMVPAGIFTTISLTLGA